VDAIQVLKSAFEGAHMWYQATIADVTAEQANHVPPGAAHPIGELAAHVLHSEDGMINIVILGKPMIWERDGWGAKLDVPLMLKQETAAARAFKCDAQQLQEYAQAVFANTAAFLDSLTPEDLDTKEIDMSAEGMGMMKLGNFLTQALLGNTYAHTGEISALKGMLGNKGYPF
jgi:uncharacterized damage-inducible protein DinB